MNFHASSISFMQCLWTSGSSNCMGWGMANRGLSISQSWRMEVATEPSQASLEVMTAL